MPEFDNAIVEKRQRVSAVWLLPIVAALIAAWLLYKNINETGLVVQVEFATGSGITAEKTLVIYQGITVGKVSDVRLNDDFQGVTAVLELDKRIAPLIRKKTAFWLVSPQISLSRISGLDTLVSGNYISFLPGEGKAATEFTALTEAPAITGDSEGLQVHLQAPALGSVSIGAPVLFHQVEVGKVEAYQLSDEGVDISLRIAPRYKHLVKAESQFWNVSGISIEASLADGVSVETGSVASILSGGIAFDSPSEGTPAENGQRYPLNASHKDLSESVKTRIHFAKADGLAKGSAVRLMGIKIGQVEALHFSGDDASAGVTAEVRIHAPYQRHLNASAEFWLVKPEINGVTVRGLDTLISGPYIAARSQGASSPLAADYSALSAPPSSRINAPGLRLKLRTEELRSVDVGSKIYYRKIAVGQVESVALDSKGVTLGIFIHEAYRKLVHRDSRFYNASGISISGGFGGLDLQADSVASILAGGIAFYTPDSPKPQRAWEGLQYTLFNDFKSSQADKGLEIVLHFANAVSLSKGTELKYQGIKVGEVVNVALDAKMAGVDVTARLEPSARALAKEGSRFWLVRPELGLVGTRNLETLVTGAYISVEPGDGDTSLHFQGLDRAPLASAPERGLNLVLITPRRGSIKEGVKVFFRDVPVGEVYGYELSQDARQTYIHINIEPRFAGLVRAGSRFWNSSGIDIEFSLFQGTSIRSKSVESLLEGGIAFATPEDDNQRVESGTRFPLQEKVKSEWLDWAPALTIGE
jgi:paraquat-inducible protein B